MSAPRFAWVALGVLLFFISSENVSSEKIRLVKKKEETVSPFKKSDIGNFDLKAYSRSIKPENCKNTKTKLQCAKMLKGDPNACLINRQLMSDYCKLTCRFCSPYSKAQKTKINRECKNHHAKCSLWAKEGDCMHYSAFMLDVCKKSCQICGNDNPSVADRDERCPTWGRTGFCGIKMYNRKMRRLCPYSCQKYSNRRYTVKYAKPPKRRSPRPTAAPKPTKPTPRPTPPLTQDEKEDMKEALEEYAEEEESRLREKEEQRQQEEEEAKITPLEAPPVLRSEKPLPIPAPALSPISLDDLNIDIPSEYEGGTAPHEKKTRIL
ncbi:uncharacterized protein LOC114532488 [Dendronephthya gigantea]|uniref:uncharacterized protein LOC114532488 n=1 Tax=Dendronephthya gigantea TaxID=151771 RepID=UPI001069334C|nr:uncharacterized protein LOC114532488 [Dendronephthya gigantea]